LRKTRAVGDLLGKVKAYRDTLAAELRTLDLSAEEKADVVRQAVEMFAEGLSELLPVIDETKEQTQSSGSPERDLISIRGHEFEDVEDVSRDESKNRETSEISENANKTTTPCHENVTFESAIVSFPTPRELEYIPDDGESTLTELDAVAPVERIAILDETEFKRQIKTRVESGELDKWSPQQFEELAHDPETRKLFSRRFMGASDNAQK
jgi:hypothetical protein